MNALTKPAIVIGGDGLLGRAYRGFWQTQGVPVPWTSRRSNLPSGALYLDFENPGPLPWEIWSEQGYTSVFIAAALTGLQTCENNPERSYQINVSTPLLLARQALEYGFSPVFCSSDSVFDGQTGNYTEQSQVRPLHVYGRHKAELELQALMLEKAIILRLTKIYTLKPQDGSLLSEMAQLLMREKTVFAAHDQVLNPVYLIDVISVLNGLLEQQFRGLIHVAGPESLTRYDLACKLAENMHVSQDLVKKISLKDVADGVMRPLRTHLNIERLRQYNKNVLLTLSEAVKQIAQIVND